ncbi:MAG: trigger factor [Xanthobacteraceae bacterium]|nr:trigger factor [Xanthobacteraceae bacterium]
MQVTETSTEGLKREFRVVVPASDLSDRVTDRLTQMKDQVKINGFRPGKVPVAHLKRVYGRAVMAEMIEQMVRETNAKIISDRGLKLAMDPKITMSEDKDEIERIIDGKTDLAYTVAVEVVPAIALANFKSITLERVSAPVSDQEVDEALQKIAAQNRPYAPKAEGGTAESGDRVTISFVGTIDGVPFEGGAGEDVPVTIGLGTFIPGFEDQIVGIAPGESRTVNVTFPENYASEKLAGKAASFAVTAKSVEAPGPVSVDEALATSLGIESLDKLREAIKARIGMEHAALSRQKLKRALLDQLDAMHKFEAPPSLVEQEFANVWNTVLSDLKSQNRTFEDEGTTEEKAREEYRGISDRRVRLGLVLAEIGEKNSIKVSDEEMQRALVDHIRQFPQQQQQQAWDYYTKNPSALAGIRAPLYEEKVVDFLVELAEVTDKTVTTEELYKDEEAVAPAS